MKEEHEVIEPKVKTFSSKDAILFGIGKLKKYCLFFSVSIVIMWVVSLLPHLLTEFTKSNLVFLAVFGAIISLFVMVFFQIGFTKVLLALSQDKKSKFSVLFSGLPLFLNYFCMSFMWMCLVIIGLFFLIVPGVIAYLQFLFAPFLVVDRQMGPLAALKRSTQLTRGSKRDLLLFSLIVLLLNIPFILGRILLALNIGLVTTIFGWLFFLVGLFITLPITLFAFVSIYEQLKKTTKV